MLRLRLQSPWIWPPSCPRPCSGFCFSSPVAAVSAGCAAAGAAGELPSTMSGRWFVLALLLAVAAAQGFPAEPGEGKEAAAPPPPPHANGTKPVQPGALEGAALIKLAGAMGAPPALLASWNATLAAKGSLCLWGWGTPPCDISTCGEYTRVECRDQERWGEHITSV